MNFFYFFLSHQQTVRGVHSYRPSALCPFSLNVSATLNSMQHPMSEQNQPCLFSNVIELYLFPTSWCLLSPRDTPPHATLWEKKDILIAVYSMLCDR